MNTKLKKIFDMQTNILQNHVLSNLIKFFLNNDITEMYLYDTITATKEITKKDFQKINKDIPRTFNYQVWIKIANNKVFFIIKNENCSEIEIYNLILSSPYPNISTLKNIASILVMNYRPLPTKIDKEFSELAKKYSDYLNYYNVKRKWNSGYTPKHPSKKVIMHMSNDELNSIYEIFLIEINALALKYRVFSKILIDIYQTSNETLYINQANTYQLKALYIKASGISIKTISLLENYHYNEIISLDDFYYNNKFFKKNVHIYNIIVSCVKPTLLKLN